MGEEQVPAEELEGQPIVDDYELKPSPLWEELERKRAGKRAGKTAALRLRDVGLDLDPEAQVREAFRSVWVYCLKALGQESAPVDPLLGVAVPPGLGEWEAVLDETLKLLRWGAEIDARMTDREKGHRYALIDLYEEAHRQGIQARKRVLERERKRVELPPIVGGGGPLTSSES
jgi:hypothetical protein